MERIHLEINALVKADVFINRREGEMSIHAAETDIPFLWVKHEPEHRSAAFRIDVGLTADALVNGPFEGQILIHTDDADFSELKIPVKGWISD